MIDTRILHEIALNPTNSIIIVYAGGAHIKEASPVLGAQGYTLVDECGGATAAAVDLDYYFKDLGQALTKSCIKQAE